MLDEILMLLHEYIHVGWPGAKQMHDKIKTLQFKMKQYFY